MDDPVLMHVVQTIEHLPHDTLDHMMRHETCGEGLGTLIIGS